MSQQAENEPAEPTNLPDTELEEVTGGATGTNSVIRRNGTGYARARLR